MKPRVEFKSTAFPKYETEDDETVNAHCWGKRLAEYVRDTLPSYGVLTEDIFSEDWGWLVYVNHEAFPLWIGCGVTDEPEDEEDESGPSRSQKDSTAVIDFALFVEAEPGFFASLFKRVDIQPTVDPVRRAIQQMMAANPEKFIAPVWAE
jgi:hypothetical protein